VNSPCQQAERVRRTCQVVTIDWTSRLARLRDDQRDVWAPRCGRRKFIDRPGRCCSTLSAEQNGKIKLARLTISTVASGNATIDLVGAVIQAGPLAIE
jgi:hypothetical protein